VSVWSERVLAPRQWAIDRKSLSYAALAQLEKLGMIELKRVAAVVLLSATCLGSWAAGESSAPSNWEKFKAYTHQQKSEAVAEGKKLMVATDKKISELSAAAKKSSGEVKVAHEKNVQELKAKKKDAQAHLDKLGKATSGAWDATKEGFSKAYKDLHESYEKVATSEKK
jgi:hypothetical protein